MKSDELDGQRIVILFLDRSDPQRIALAAGTGRWNGTYLEVALRPGDPSVRVPQEAVERDGFNPKVLPRLVANERYVPMAERWADEVTWCAPMLVDEVPLGAAPTPGFLGGLAIGREGKLYLMQVR